jgi:hypothetical protein
MADTTITVRSNKTDREIEFTRDFGGTIEESVELFGAETVHAVFVAQATIRAQGAARSVLDNAEKSTDEAINAGNTYTPGVVRRAASKKDPFYILAVDLPTVKGWGAALRPLIPSFIT